MVKDSTRNALKSITYDSYVEDFSKGATITGSYPLSASITRIFYESGDPQNGVDLTGNSSFKEKYYYQTKGQTKIKKKNFHNEAVKKSYDASILKKKYIQGLENTINYYRKWSPHFVFSSSADPLTGQSLPENAWEKSYQNISIIEVPSIFFGSSIKKGSVSLKYYITGTLVGQLQDERKNGELIQTGPAGSTGTGSVAGIVLYNEGALVITGSWTLGNSAVKQDYRYYGSDDSPSWIYFGTGMNDSYPLDWDAEIGQYYDGSSYRTLDADSFHSSSFELAFSGTNYIPTITMMAHAKKGYLNWSNNPTYVEYGQPTGSVTGSVLYKESDSIVIKNTISSSFNSDYTASFKKQTFINKIGIYDKDKNLIAIAKVATPVRKLETDEYTFKLKLDI